MATLTYWVAKCRNDHQCYSIRAKTRKAVIAALTEHDHASFDPPCKVTVEYDNAFDLMKQCMNEGGGFWEA